MPYKPVHRTVYDRLKAKPTVPRKSHVKKAPDAEQAFIAEQFAQPVDDAKQPPQQLPVNVFAQDESRLGLMTIIRRSMTGRSVKPIVPVQQNYETMYL